MTENLGGSGGFYEGLKKALQGQWQWFWLMDDDAIPESDALEKLFMNAHDTDTVYGSTAINGRDGITRLCWPVIIKKNDQKRFIEFPEMLADTEEVDMIPFIGFFIHRTLVERVGYPDPGYFICADDKEYCERIKLHGSKLVLVKSSKIHHPPASISLYDFGLFQAAYRSLPTWKIYYDVRNKILIGKKYFRNRFLIQTLPGILLRVILGVLKKDNPALTISMTLKAVFDGMLNRKGKKITPP